MITFEEVMACSTSNKTYFDKLSELVSKGRIVPFVGAGMSIPFYPSWKDVLKKMISGYVASSNVEDLLKDNKYEEAATLVRNEVGNTAFNNIFAGEFASSKLNGKTFRESQKLLPRLFNGMVVTTNYDKVLEIVYGQQSAGFSHTMTPSTHIAPMAVVEPGIRENNHILFKLHGDVDDSSSRVLTEEEYERIYGALKEKRDKTEKVKFKKGSYLEMLAYMLIHSSFLFLGCSLLSDRPLELLQLQTGESLLSNFAFLEKPKITDAESQIAFDKRRKELADKSILAIWYPTEKHEDSLSVLLQELLNRKCDYNSQNKAQAILEQNTSQLTSLADTVEIINIAYSSSLTVENIQQVIEFSPKIDIMNSDHIVYYAEDTHKKASSFLELSESYFVSLLNSDYKRIREDFYRKIKRFLSKNDFWDGLPIQKLLWERSVGDIKRSLDATWLRAWQVDLIKTSGMVRHCEDEFQKNNNEITMYTIALQLAIKREKQQTEIEKNLNAARKRLDWLQGEKKKLADTIRKFENIRNAIMDLILCIDREISCVDMLKSISFSKLKTSVNLIKNYVDAYNETSKKLGELSAQINLE